jgi:hypothetical protein
VWTWLRKFSIIRKILGEKPVARPRRVKLGEGEITLHNYTPEFADKLQKHLDSFREEVIGPKVGDIVELKEDSIEVVDTTTLSCTALDLYQDPKTKEYQVVFIKYNPVSKSAKVVDFRNAGSFRNAGINNFKIELVKEGKI